MGKHADWAMPFSVEALPDQSQLKAQTGLSDEALSRTSNSFDNDEERC